MGSSRESFHEFSGKLAGALSAKLVEKLLEMFGKAFGKAFTQIVGASFGQAFGEAFGNCSGMFLEKHSKEFSGDKTNISFELYGKAVRGVSRRHSMWVVRGSC